MQDAAIARALASGRHFNSLLTRTFFSCPPPQAARIIYILRHSEGRFLIQSPVLLQLPEPVLMQCC